MTKAGSDKNINEDSFHCMTRIYPDTLDSLEVQSGQSEDHWQIYSITDGMGGSGIGDISGRLVQEDLIKQVSKLGDIDPQTFDFAEFSYDFISSVKFKLKERLSRYRKQEVGCSLAFLLINGSTAYTLSIGTNRLYLIRNNKLYRMSQEQRVVVDGIAKPTMFLGNSFGGVEAKPQNLNKLILESDDIILLLSDGVYDVLPDKEILQLSQSNKSFVKVINNFLSELQKHNVVDDGTVLGLKVLEASAINISDRLVSEQPTEPIDMSHLHQANLTNDMDTDFYDDDYYRIQTDATKSEKLEDEPKSKFIQILTLFLKSYGIGIAIGIVLMFLFWLIYFKLS